MWKVAFVNHEVNQLKQAVRALESLLADSPLTALSLLTGAWLFVSGLSYRFNRTGVVDWLLGKLFSIHHSHHPLESASILTLFAIIGASSALVGELREEEDGWFICLVTMVANCCAWWFSVSQLDFTFQYSS